MDNDTAAVSIKSQLEDIDDLSQGYNTESDGDGDLDAQLALKIY